MLFSIHLNIYRVDATPQLFAKNYNKAFPDNSLDEKEIHMEVAGFVVAIAKLQTRHYYYIRAILFPV